MKSLSVFGIFLCVAPLVAAQPLVLPPTVKCRFSSCPLIGSWRFGCCPPSKAFHEGSIIHETPNGDLSDNFQITKRNELAEPHATSGPAVDKDNNQKTPRTLTSGELAKITTAWETFKKQWPGIKVTIDALDKAGAFGGEGDRTERMKSLGIAMKQFGTDVSQALKDPTQQNLQDVATSKATLGRQLPGIVATVDALQAADALPARDGMTAEQRKVELVGAMKELSDSLSVLLDRYRA